MPNRSQLRWRATLLLIGTIIGAGIFGIPAAIGAWGIAVSTIAFAIVTLVILAAQLLYAEAVLANGRNARLEAHAERWLGKPAGSLAGAIQALQVFGSNLAYIILGGEFLAIIARACGLNVPLIVWQIGFWVAGSFIVCFGLKLAMRAEAYLTWMLIVTIVLLIIAFFLRIQPSDVMLLAFTLPERLTFEPYGIIFFSLLGITPVPEIVEAVERRREDVYQAIIRATIASAVLTYVFGVFGWLVSSGLIGRNPSDLIRFVHPAVAFLFPIAGFLAIITSYIATALDLREMFHLDYHFSDVVSWFVALGVPLLLLFLTPRDFLSTIGLVGAVFGTAIAIIVSLMGYRALLKNASKRPSLAETLWIRAVPLVTVVVLVTGGVLWTLLSNP